MRTFLQFLSEAKNQFATDADGKKILDITKLSKNHFYVKNPHMLARDWKYHVKATELQWAMKFVGDKAYDDDLKPIKDEFDAFVKSNKSLLNSSDRYAWNAKAYNKLLADVRSKFPKFDKSGKFKKLSDYDTDMRVEEPKPSASDKDVDLGALVTDFFK